MLEMKITFLNIKRNNQICLPISCIGIQFDDVLFQQNDFISQSEWSKNSNVKKNPYYAIIYHIHNNLNLSICQRRLGDWFVGRSSCFKTNFSL